MAETSVPLTLDQKIIALERAMRALQVCTMALEHQGCDADQTIADMLVDDVGDPLRKLRDALRAEALS